MRPEGYRIHSWILIDPDADVFCHLLNQGLITATEDPLPPIIHRLKAAAVFLKPVEFRVGGIVGLREVIIALRRDKQAGGLMMSYSETHAPPGSFFDDPGLFVGLIGACP